jgi:hypothetical protein
MHLPLCVYSSFWWTLIISNHKCPAPCQPWKGSQVRELPEADRQVSSPQPFFGDLGRLDTGLLCMCFPVWWLLIWGHGILSHCDKN